MANKPGSRFGTKADALAYLYSNSEFLSLWNQTRAGKSIADALGEAQAKRYAGAMYTAQVQGRHPRSLSELRGHVASENKRDRKGGGVKRGFEDYVPPERVKRGWYMHPDSSGKYVADVRVTSGEASAVRAIVDAAGFERKNKRGGMLVAINITGGEPGQYAQLFWRGGYDARKLLGELGYREKHNGRWEKPAAGGYGLRQWLLDYLADMPGAHYQDWEGIKLYEVYRFPESAREKADPAARVFKGA